MSNAINKNFKENAGHFFVQALLIIVFMACVLFPLGSLKSSVFTAVGASTLAASIVMAFALPESPAAAVHRIFGGYMIGLLIGLLWHAALVALEKHASLPAPLPVDICGALAVGMTMILMGIFGLLHPPSVGLSLAIVIGPWSHWTIIVVVVAVLILCLIKYLLRNWFINLL